MGAPLHPPLGMVRRQLSSGQDRWSGWERLGGQLAMLGRERCGLALGRQLALVPGGGGLLPRAIRPLLLPL